MKSLALRSQLVAELKVCCRSGTFEVRGKTVGHGFDGKAHVSYRLADRKMQMRQRHYAVQSITSTIQNRRRVVRQLCKEKFVKRCEKVDGEGNIETSTHLRFTRADNTP